MHLSKLFSFTKPLLLGGFTPKQRLAMAA